MLKRIWAANSRDEIARFFLVYLSSILSYSRPYFLRCAKASFYFIFAIIDKVLVQSSKILDCLDKEHLNKKDRYDAYIYAILTFVVTLLQVRYLFGFLFLWLGS